MNELETQEKEGQKLKTIRNNFGMTQTEFAKELETTQAAIAMIEKGQRAVNTTIKYKLLQKFSIDWEADILSGEALAKIVKISENHSPSVGIPYYEAKVAAGGGYENVNYPDSKVLYFDKRWLENVLNVQPEHLSIVKAEGDSMYPCIKSGDLLMVDNSSINIINNKIFVIKQGDYYRVKRLKKEIDGAIKIISDNPIYPIETMDKETEIIGQVVWNGNKEVI
jgi:phage repressor protein C with HTH and peptisase S24 domain